MVFLNKLIEKKSGRVISQYSIIQEPLKQPDVVPWLKSGFLTIILISACLMIMGILDSFFFFFFFKASFVIFVSLDYQKFFLYFFFPFLPLAALRLAEKACSIPGLCCLNPPPHPTLPPFPNVSPASPAPTEERKLVPSNWYKGTFCFHATDAKRRGKGKEKTSQMVKKGKKWDPLQWSLSKPVSHSALLFVGKLVTGLSPTQSTWWQLLVSKE